MDTNHCSLCGSLLTKNEFDVCRNCANKFGLGMYLQTNQKPIHKNVENKKYRGTVRVNYKSN